MEKGSTDEVMIFCFFLGLLFWHQNLHICSQEREKVPDFGVIIDTEEARVLRGYDAKNMKRKSAVPDKSWADYAEQNKQYRSDHSLTPSSGAMSRPFFGGLIFI